MIHISRSPKPHLALAATETARLLPRQLPPGRADRSDPSMPLDATFMRTWVAAGRDKACGRLHAIHPAVTSDVGALTGFALTLLRWLQAARAERTRIATSQPLLWIQDSFGRMEAGRPYGAGLRAFGFDPADLVMVAARNPLEAMTAAEIGLETGALAGVVVELSPKLPADMLRLGKRLALRAERSQVGCLLLHASAEPVAMPVATRWRVSGCASIRDKLRDKPWMPATPVIDLTLDKNRFGMTGRWRAALLSPPTGERLCHDHPAASVSSPTSILAFLELTRRSRSKTGDETGPKAGPRPQSAHPVSVAAPTADRPVATEAGVATAA